MKVECDDVQLFANNIELYRDDGRFVATGDVVVVSGVNRSSAERLDFATKTTTGTCYTAAGTTGIEFTTAGLSFAVDGSVSMACDGGAFEISIDGIAKSWPTRAVLKDGAVVDINPGVAGNYGYLRFDRRSRSPR